MQSKRTGSWGNYTWIFSWEEELPEFKEGEDYQLFNPGDGSDKKGPRWTTGISGSGLEFDGLDDYVEIPHSKSLDISGPITIEVWIKLNRFFPNWRAIVSKGSSEHGWYNLGISGGMESKMATILRVGRESIQVMAETNLELNKWYHLAMTYDQKNIKLYLNGKSEKSQPETGVIKNSNAPLYLGNSHGSATHHGGRLFPGIIDEVEIYNKALTAEEIKEDYEKY